MKKYTLFSLIICLILGGCYTTSQSVSTPTAKPEVIINSTDIGKIKSAVINYYMDMDYSIISESDYSMVFSTAEEPFGTAAYKALTGEYNSTSRQTIRISIATVSNSTRMLAKANFIIKNENGREDVKDVSNDWADLLLKQLQTIKAQAEKL
jgi:PBP1b-binding outer membrane lipoprotein LpoB